MAEITEGFLLGIDNPLLDISAEVPLEFIQKYGLQLNNATLSTDETAEIPAILVKDYKVTYIPGGASQNAIRTFQWMIGKPRSSVVLGSVGKDDFANILIERISSEGVIPLYSVDETTPTGNCSVLINAHERSLVASLGAANNYKIDHLKTPEIWSYVEKAKYFYISGYSLTVVPDGMELIAKHANETGKFFSINLSAPFISQVPPFFNSLKNLLPYVDILFGNEGEARAFGTASGLDESASVADIALYIARLPKENASRPRIAVITQGSSPTIVAYADGTIHTYPVPPLLPEQMVDFNGAGDSFVGGFLSSHAKGETIAQSINAAQYAARQIIQQSGLQFPGPCDFVQVSADEAASRATA
eukprot:TRINITY_DN1037_c0_g1_i1.p1 TRINITY_DN1037_c0_g1~~TRINITY_DN1037_c0_g1_i1.p1  ORF type:complete len:361 (+),score=198.65 TRINITY_DN1037_c0_g1_i1:136-1218(+)